MAIVPAVIRSLFAGFPTLVPILDPEAGISLPTRVLICVRAAPILARAILKVAIVAVARPLFRVLGARGFALVVLVDPLAAVIRLAIVLLRRDWISPRFQASVGRTGAPVVGRRRKTSWYFALHRVKQTSLSQSYSQWSWQSSSSKFEHSSLHVFQPATHWQLSSASQSSSYKDPISPRFQASVGRTGAPVVGRTGAPVVGRRRKTPWYFASHRVKQTSLSQSYSQ